VPGAEDKAQLLIATKNKQRNTKAKYRLTLRNFGGFCIARANKALANTTMIRASVKSNNPF
jgi:hypothetical protein